ncbi:MAG: hypothetical protein WBW33_00190 [Bryobacteraceae bacterium]
MKCKVTPFFNRVIAAFGATLLLIPLLDAQPPQMHRGPRLDACGPGSKNRTKCPKYEFVTFDIPDGYYDTLFGINNDRLAVGWYYDSADNPTRVFSFLWRNGTEKQIESSSSSIVYFGDVNDRGLAFGTIGSADTQAAVFDVRRNTLTPLPDVPGKKVNQAMRMNNYGVGVGQACAGNWWTEEDQCIGWIWDGKAYSYVTLPGTDQPWTGPLAINDWNQVVGQYYDKDGAYHSYLQDHSRIVVLDVKGASSTYVNAINNFGEILLDGFFAGNANTNYIWKGGVLTPLPSFPSPDAVNTYAYGLNDHGDYCGRWYDAQGESHAFVAYRQ